MNSKIAAAGDTVESICAEHYGRASGYTEMVLAADENRGLAELLDAGYRVPAGTVVYLPESDPRTTQASVKQWWS